MSSTLTAPQPPRPVNQKGRPISYEGAITKFFTGLAFLAVSCALAFSNSGRGWWFWMLIPAFGSIGRGIAQYLQIRRFEKGNAQPSTAGTSNIAGAAPNAALPPQQTAFVSPESRYKTGDLVPPSVTDRTTRHLEMDSESQTMALPKK